MTGFIQPNKIKPKHHTSSRSTLQLHPTSPSLKKSQREPKKTNPTDNVLPHFIDHAIRLVERSKEETGGKRRPK